MAIPIVVVAWYAAVTVTRQEGLPYATTAPQLRMTGLQFVLNWQSFPGRRVTVEYCTIGVSADGQVTCRVIERAAEIGQIIIDADTFDAASAEWARATCSGTEATRACTSRVTGNIRRRSDGRPMLDQAKIDR